MIRSSWLNNSGGSGFASSLELRMAKAVKAEGQRSCPDPADLAEPCVAAVAVLGNQLRVPGSLPQLPMRADVQTPGRAATSLSSESLAAGGRRSPLPWWRQVPGAARPPRGCCEPEILPDDSSGAKLGGAPAAPLCCLAGVFLHIYHTCQIKWL